MGPTQFLILPKNRHRLSKTEPFPVRCLRLRHVEHECLIEHCHWDRTSLPLPPFFFFVDAADVFRCSIHRLCFSSTGKGTIRRVRLLYSPRQTVVIGLHHHLRLGYDSINQAQISRTDSVRDTLNWNLQKTSSSVELLSENCRNVFFKNMRHLWTLLW